MITYVNTVLVGKGNGLYSGDINDLKFDTRAEFTQNSDSFANMFVIEETTDAKFRVGLITNKMIETYVKGDHTVRPLIKWSNAIKKEDIKSFNVTNYNADANKEDVITIDFTNAIPEDDADTIEDETKDLANKRIVLRLTFKDTPTRYRKWTESYEYTVKYGDSAEDIANGLVKTINENYKRARIDAKADGAKLVLTALPYDDDEMIDSISPFAKVRFSANLWMTDPMAHGFASKNKYAVTGVVIEKTPGIAQVGEWKVVRDAEAQAMGYAGILNRGECTWPIIKPDMNVEMYKTYDSLTLEFENMYRTADDLQRKTKQTLQIFETAGNLSDIASKIAEIAGIEEDVKPEIKLDADKQGENA